MEWCSLLIIKWCTCTTQVHLNPSLLIRSQLSTNFEVQRLILNFLQIPFQGRYNLFNSLYSQKKWVSKIGMQILYWRLKKWVRKCAPCANAHLAHQALPPLHFKFFKGVAHMFQKYTRDDIFNVVLIEFKKFQLAVPSI